MTQTWTDIAGTDTVGGSRTTILSRDETLKSNFSGTTFPTTNLVAGMSCWRIDLTKMYSLVSIGPDVWIEQLNTASVGTAAFEATGSSGHTIPFLDGTNSFSGTITCTAATALSVGDNVISGTTGGLVFSGSDVLLNANSSKNVELGINGASKLKVWADGGITVGSPTGSSKGDGTLNVASLYINGSAVGTAATHASTDFLGTALTHNYIFVGNSSNVATGVPVSGDISIADTGAMTLDVGVTRTYTKAQGFGETTLTDASTISWDARINQTTKVTLGGNRTMAAPTNLVAGFTYIIRVIQDGTGSRTITWNAVFKWSVGSAPTLSTGAGKVDLISFYCDGTNLIGSALLDVR